MRNLSPDLLGVAVALLHKAHSTKTRTPSSAEIERREKEKERADWNAEVERKNAQRAQAQKGQA